jgi:hypothetical protein
MTIYKHTSEYLKDKFNEPVKKYVRISDLYRVVNLLVEAG